jgi:hypothetical protein
MAPIFVNVPNLEIHLEEDHLEEIRMEDHHSIHLDWIIWMPNTWPMHVYTIVVSTTGCITCTRTNN